MREDRRFTQQVVDDVGLKPLKVYRKDWARLELLRVL